jgi:hypothetical protein
MTDEELARAAQQIEDVGVSRYGKETWGVMVGAIGRSGVAPSVIAQVLHQPDAFDRLQHAGKEALLKEAENGNREAERIYDGIRQRERRAYQDSDSSAYRRLPTNAERR